MKNRIVISAVRISDNRIDYDWYPEGDVKECFRLTEPLFYEYSETIKDVPKSIAVLPFLCNILPLAWLYDAEIIIDEVDRTFYENLGKVKEGFVEMYPMLSFKGNLQAQVIIENSFSAEKPKSAVFFSGGVDSNFTLIDHLEAKPALITILGADIALTDESGMEVLKKLSAQTSQQYNLDSVIITSSFRKCLNYRKLDAKTAISHNGYWGGFQHGMAICGQAFPYAFLKGINTVFIASSRAVHDKEENQAWGSAPSIDDNLRFASGRVIHDGYYKYDRQDKIRHIREYVSRTGQKVHLHVCWETGGGKNCNCCEKCFRTMLALLLEGGNPNEYGFNFTAKTGFIMENYFKHVYLLHGMLLQRWIELQEKFRINRSDLTGDRSFDWFASFDFSAAKHSYSQKIRLFRSIWKRRLRALSEKA